LYAVPDEKSDDLLTNHKLVIEDQPGERTLKVPLAKGCPLILEVVDAVTGKGIPGVTFLKGLEAEGILSQGTSFVTDDQGKRLALVAPGIQRYAIETVNIEGYSDIRPFDHKEVACERGKTSRLQFKLDRR
jgi:hypothetical protein